VNLKLDENLGNTAAELFRQAGHGVEMVPSHDDLLLACRTLIAGLAQETITGKLWTVQRGRIREYRPDRPEEEREDA
jgi:hypothetical protein